MQKVSVIVPCRNEEKFISLLIDSILAQDYPVAQLETFIVDGESTDHTREIIQEKIRSHPHFQLLSNPKKYVSPALNLGIAKSTGQVIVRMDAHATYPADYISRLIKAFDDSKADNVGAMMITVPANQGLIAKSIALALSNWFGIGNAHFRTGANQPMEVDTVPFGCYRRSVFDKIGMFDEDLIRNQDDELNARLIHAGGKVMLFPEIKIQYTAREHYGKLATMMYQYGFYKPLVLKKIGRPATLRQLVPPLLVAALILLSVLSFFMTEAKVLLIFTVGLYLLMDIVISFILSTSTNFKLLPFLGFTFPVIHFSYGFGYWQGIFQFLILNKRGIKPPKNISR